jgi:hypothetical protein
MVHSTGQAVRRAILGFVLTVLVLPAAALAQPAIGFQGGGSVDPEQGFVGVFWQSPDLAGTFRIRPGVDGGFGDGLRIATINVDFLYAFPLGATGWKIVQGGGPVIAITRFDVAPGRSESETSAGGSYLFGFSHESGFFTEFRVAGGNVPSLKFGAGWAIRLD